MKYLLYITFCVFILSSQLPAREVPLPSSQKLVEIQSVAAIEINPVLDNAGVDSRDFQLDQNIIHVSKKPILEMKDFTGARFSKGSLDLDLTSRAGNRIHLYTEKNLGKRMAFFANGKLIKAPVIRSVIDGTGISVNPIDDELGQKLAKQINRK